MAAQRRDIRLVSSRPIPRKWLQETPPRRRPPRRLRSLWKAAPRLVGLAVFVVVAIVAGRFAATPEAPLTLGQGPIAGRVDYVVDGDTLDLRGQRIRLEGIDAPEHDQTCRRADGADWSCGIAASERLRALVRGRDIACEPLGYDRYGRTVATCRDGSLDLGATLVREGLAVATTRYAVEEAGARSSSAGIWQGDFMRPADWRHRTSTDPASPLDPGSGNPSRFERFWAWLTRLVSG